MGARAMHTGGVLHGCLPAFTTPRTAILYPCCPSQLATSSHQPHRFVAPPQHLLVAVLWQILNEGGHLVYCLELACAPVLTASMAQSARLEEEESHCLSLWQQADSAGTAHAEPWAQEEQACERSHPRGRTLNCPSPHAQFALLLDACALCGTA